NGKPLKGSAYPPGTVLYRRSHADYAQDGHTQRVEVAGRVQELRSAILHDDRKPLAHWIRAQSRYMKLEADKLLESGFRQLGWADRLRKARFFAPPLMLFYCLFVKGVVLNGRIGIFYALQRTFSEFLLSLYLIENDLNVKERRRGEIRPRSKVQSPKSGSL
ncbi:MAG: hypothetical protein QOJ64_1918, partial [Acidobacteriota bacterium]|nr:hypothetical protein [Acidobacteriota bacterium]